MRSYSGMHGIIDTWFKLFISHNPWIHRCITSMHGSMHDHALFEQCWVLHPRFCLGLNGSCTERKRRSRVLCQTRILFSCLILMEIRRVALNDPCFSFLLPHLFDHPCDKTPVIDLLESLCSACICDTIVSIYILPQLLWLPQPGLYPREMAFCLPNIRWNWLSKNDISWICLTGHICLLSLTDLQQHHHFVNNVSVNHSMLFRGKLYRAVKVHVSAEI